MDRPSVGELLTEYELVLASLDGMQDNEIVGPKWNPITVKEVVGDIEPMIERYKHLVEENGANYIEPDVNDYHFE